MAAAGGAPASGGAPGAAGSVGAGARGSGGAPGAQNGTGGFISTGTGGTAPYSTGDAGKIVFSWPESTSAGPATSCKAGHYVGTFECNYRAAGTPDSSAPFLVNGPVDMTLNQSQSGEFLEVSGGTLTGAAVLIISFTANVIGKLNCSTGMFDGSLTNGVYGFPGLPAGKFAGPMRATYSATGPALINGTWELQQQSAGSAGSCVGTWTAKWQP
jgi:hypothetical protein